MLYLKIYLAILAILVAFFLGAIVDSLRRNGSEALLTDLKAISRLLPSPDPGMNNSARYIRHLGLSTPASAFPDYPGQPDYLPSGMMWPPLHTFVGIRNEFSISGSYTEH